MILKRIVILFISIASSLSCTKDEYAALNEKGTFTLPKMPYTYDFLQPQYWSQLLYYHHVKVHQFYVDDLNTYIKNNSTYTGLSLTDLIIQYGASDSSIANYAGGHYNHSLLWWILLNSRCGDREPNNNLGLDIDSTFGSFDEFKTAFTDTALDFDGSGWVWACVKSGKIEIRTSDNENSPLAGGDCYPFLGLDLWEHSYYYYYQWDVEEFIDSWWEIIDWNMVEFLYEEYAYEGKAIPV